MNQSFDVVYPKCPNPNEPHKRVWIRVGVAFLDSSSDTGNLVIRLDTVPLDDSGHPFTPKELSVFLNRPRKKDE